MVWQLKFLRSSMFALVPGGTWLRTVKRKFVPYPAQLDPATVEHAFEMISMLDQAGLPPRGRRVLEVGSGWRPIIPLLMRLAGAERVYLVDSQRLLDVQLMRGIATQLRDRADEIADRLGTSSAEVRGTLEFPPDANLDQLLEHFHLTYLAPADAAALSLIDGTIDIAISRAVLEHIPVAALARIFDELHRVVNESGGMCHIVDNSDHWSHGDARLSRISFLRYSESRWRWFAINPLDFQNRLRHSDYLQLTRNAGFRIVEDRSVPDARAVDDLRHVSVDRAFEKYHVDDLATLTSRFVARPDSSALRHVQGI